MPVRQKEPWNTRSSVCTGWLLGHWPYPESLAISLKLADREFEKEINTISLIKLYELGKISSGTASKILGINRVDFIEKIGEYQVSIFQFS